MEDTIMPKVIATATVEDAAKWEAGFRTHGELFRRQTVRKPIHFNVTKQNTVTICFEPDDLDTFMKLIDSRDTEEAMKADGVKRETTRFIILDKAFDPR